MQKTKATRRQKERAKQRHTTTTTTTKRGWNRTTTKKEKSKPSGMHMYPHSGISSSSKWEDGTETVLMIPGTENNNKKTSLFIKVVVPLFLFTGCARSNYHFSLGAAVEKMTSPRLVEAIDAWGVVDSMDYLRGALLLSYISSSAAHTHAYLLVFRLNGSKLVRCQFDNEICNDREEDPLLSMFATISATYAFSIVYTHLLTRCAGSGTSGGITQIKISRSFGLLTRKRKKKRRRLPRGVVFRWSYWCCAQSLWLYLFYKLNVLIS